MDKIYYDLHVTYKNGEILHDRKLTYNELLMKIVFYMNWHIKHHIDIKEIVID